MSVLLEAALEGEGQTHQGLPRVVAEMELDLGLLRVPVSGFVLLEQRGVLAQMVPHLQVVISWGTTGIPFDLDVTRDIPFSLLPPKKKKENVHLILGSAPTDLVAENVLKIEGVVRRVSVREASAAEAGTSILNEVTMTQ